MRRQRPVRDRWRNYRDTARKYQREWKRRRKLAFMLFSFQVRCAQCGACPEDISQLHFDHIDEATKLCDPAGIWSYNRVSRLAELAKCQVLCSSCNLQKEIDRRSRNRTEALEEEPPWDVPEVADIDLIGEAGLDG